MIPDDAYILNVLWDWGVKRAQMTGHPYYIVLAQDIMAFVRGCK